MSTQLQTADSTAVDIIDQDNPDSIFNQPRFPSRTRPIEFSPKQLYITLITYSECITPLSDVLKNAKIERDTFFKLVGLYPEISAAYSAARLKKAQKFGEVIERTFSDLPEEEELYVYDREGNKSLSTAGANYLKIKADNMHRIAMYHETGSFVPVSKQENTNRTLSLQVNINGKLPPDFDLSNCDPTALVSVLKGKRWSVDVWCVDNSIDM